ncbi:MAG: peroxiredoxin [Oligoflexia bacterium]|nr:peroxiredoxin [Oligoflexia bacterium]
MNKAQDFSLFSSEGRKVSLYELLKKGTTLLAFYPGNFTPTCTKQLCDYRDNFSEFSSLGVQVVGISSDSIDSHKKFSESYQFPFIFLSDPKREVFSLYGVKSKILFNMNSRAVFLIDKDGNILFQKKEFIPITHMNSKDLLSEIKKKIDGDNV